MAWFRPVRTGNAKWTAAVCLAFALHGSGETLPTGTQLSIVVRSEVSSKHSKIGDTVHAALLAPVPSAEHSILSPGLQITGAVRAVADHHTRGDRLQIVFDQMQRPGGFSVALSAKVAAIDNARESVANDGTIYGLKPVKIQPTKKEDLLMAAMYTHPLVLASFEGVRLLRKEMEDPAIHYPAGVEMTLELTAPLNTDPLTGFVLPNAGTPVPAAVFAGLVASQPLRTEAGGRLSDQTNLLFVAKEQELDAAFLKAGWSRAAQGGVRNDLRTFLAMFERHGYDAAPVSTLTLNGKPPDRVFEKQTNTFSKRHHVRIWLRPDSLEGKPVWVGAATHDIGIVFSTETRHFTHRVESNVDLERERILNELRFAARVKEFAHIARPSAQSKFENATGDHLVTDGRMAAMTLQE